MNEVSRRIFELSDPDEYVRLNAAMRLGELKDGRALSPLIVALNDPDWHVREAARDCLIDNRGAIGSDTAAIALLVKTLNEGDEETRESAADILAEAGVPAIGALTEEILGLKAGPRISAAEVVDRIASTHPEDPEVMRAVELLAEMRAECEWGIDIGLEHALSLLHSGEREDDEARACDFIRRIALEDPEDPTLAKAIAKLSEMLNDEGDENYAGCVEPEAISMTLAVMGRAGIKSLADTAVNGGFEARLNAVWALRGYAKEIKLEQELVSLAVPALVEALLYESTGYNAASALKKIGFGHVDFETKVLCHVILFELEEISRIGLPAVPPLLDFLEYDWTEMGATHALRELLNGCGTPESIGEFEKKVMEAMRPLPADECRANGMLQVGKAMNLAAMRRNALARSAMQKDGLILAGERPKPPKGGRNEMYRGMEARLAR